MCKDFFSKLFRKKEPVTEETVTGSMVTNEEIIPADTVNVVVNEDVITGDKPIVVTPDEPIGGNKPYEGVNFVILLDNGHAKSTPGKRSPKLPNGKQFFEWEFNRDVVKRIAAGLEKLGIKYHILVPENDKDISLTTRANRANEYCKKYGTKNCFFISVHSNAYGDGSTWTDPGKWSVWTTVGVTKSDEYGKVLYDVAMDYLKPYGFTCRDGKVQGNGNAGPDYEENFTVIYKAWCPAILTENLFYTNKKECEWLMTDKGRQVIADIHIEGIRRIADSF